LVIDANAFILLGAVFISQSVNLYTNAMSPDVRPHRFSILIVAALVSFIAAAGWSFLGWALSGLQRILYSDSLVGRQDREGFWMSIIDSAFMRLASSFFIAVVASVVSLVLLVFPHTSATTKPKEATPSLSSDVQPSIGTPCTRSRQDRQDASNAK
jgi:hypothetical protein